MSFLEYEQEQVSKLNVRLHGVTRTKMFLQGPFIMDTKSGKLKEIMLELIKECGSSKINKKIM